MSPNTTYHYHVVGNNEGGISDGTDATFITSESVLNIPIVTTSSATNITENSATLNGIVNSNNSSTTVVFEYGLTNSYGNQIAAVQSPITGSTDVNVNANLTGLQSNKIYHYRVKATNNNGTSNWTGYFFYYLCFCLCTFCWYM